MKKCFCSVLYEDGRRQVAMYKLETRLPFGLEEAEGWITEQDTGVEKVKCFVRKEDALSHAIQTWKEGDGDGANNGSG